MKIRKVNEQDLNEWLRMRCQLWPNSGDEHKADIDDFFLGKQFDISEVFVLDNNAGGLSGFIELNIRNFAEGSYENKVPYVEGWYIDSDKRGKGYGKQLMQAAEKWARERGCHELASDAELDNLGSIAAHSALGFEETYRIVCFLKKLK